MIARIDERDYRIALQQAEAQVAAVQASIENIDPLALTLRKIKLGGPVLIGHQGRQRKPLGKLTCDS